MWPQPSPDANYKHQQGLQLLNSGRLEDALPLLGQALAQEETCERWNDWAAAEFLLGRAVEAEHGFRRALELDPNDIQAAENLGLLLLERRRVAEAMVFLARVVAVRDGHQTPVTSPVVDGCRREMRKWFEEFQARLVAKPMELEAIPRWPLTRYAMRLAQLGEAGAALEMVRFNRHFQPDDIELIKLQACLEQALRTDLPSQG